jgi:hypothetical protein
MDKKPTGTDYMGRTFSQFVDSLGSKLDSQYQFSSASPTEFDDFMSRPFFQHTYIDLQVVEQDDQDDDVIIIHDKNKSDNEKKSKSKMNASDESLIRLRIGSESLINSITSNRTLIDLTLDECEQSDIAEKDIDDLTLIQPQSKRVKI